VEALVVRVTGGFFAVAGLTSSMLHLGKPLRAWRAFSQWRSSWLSREGVASVLSFVPLLGLLLAFWFRADLVLLRVLAVFLALTAAVTVFCTARIYSSLKTIRAWHNEHVLPGYALLGLLGGAGWLWVIDALLGADETPLRAFLPFAVALLGAGAAVIKRGYWVFIDTAPLPATAESATGLGRLGTVHGFEAPHTEENYLTREMGFVLARKHSARLRVLAIVLFALVPVAAAVLAYCVPAAVVAASLVAALAASAGTFVERWLFFAEARHVVMLYYAGVNR
jgi:DMSO reductase anchor subunit